MAKPVKIFADLSIQNGAGEIRLKNDADGSLVLDFPNSKAFNSFSENFLNAPIPFKPSFRSIGKANAALLERRQPVIVRVNHEDWVVLGRNPKASIMYRKLAPVYLKKQLKLKTALYILGSGIAVTLSVLFFRKRN